MLLWCHFVTFISSISQLNRYIHGNFPIHCKKIWNYFGLFKIFPHICSMKIVTIDSLPDQEDPLSQGLVIGLSKVPFFEAQFLEGFITRGLSVVYIMHGETEFMLDNRRFHASSQDLVIIARNEHLKGIMRSYDLTYRLFFFSSEFTDLMIDKLQKSWGYINLPSTRRGGLYHITQKEGDVLSLYYDLLETKSGENRRLTNSIDHLCEAFGYDLLDMMYRHILTDDEAAPRVLSEDDAHYDKFTHLLRETEPMVHEMDWFAEQVGVTTRYLTTLCQRKMHQTPSALIEQAIVRRAVRQLRKTNLPINQISQQLGFSNQSYFGTYLRRTTGKGPQEIRREG